MRLVIQRVRNASVNIGEEEVSDTTSQYLSTKSTAKPYQAHSARKSAAEFSAPTCRYPSSTTARHHHHRLPTEGMNSVK